MSDGIFPEFAANDAELKQAINCIATALYSPDQEIDFLFGAGMSFTAKLPDGARLATLLLRKFFPDIDDHAPSSDELATLADRYPFEAVIQAVEASPALGGTREALSRFLMAIYRDPNIELQDEHHGFSAVCNLGGTTRIRRVFTTNFDPLLEKALGNQAFPVTEKNVREIRSAQDRGLIPILYLHGLLDQTFQITESDVLAEDESLMVSEFNGALCNSDAFVFVGYAMNDPDFRRIYQKYRKYVTNRDQAGKWTFVVGPAKNAHDYQLGSAIWKNRGAVWIPLTAAAFFEALKNHLKSQVSASVRQAIMTKYDISADDEAAYRELVQRTAEVLRVEIADAEQFLLAALPKTGAKK